MNTDPQKSTTFCGCDEGANHMCQRHWDEMIIAKVIAPAGNAEWEKAHAPAPFIGIGGAPSRCTILPTDPAERKKYPIASGFMDYFPDAIAAVANISWAGSEQHHPGEPLHWDRNKSTDEADTMQRHFSQRGTLDTDGKRHTAKAAWRLMAYLQKEIEQERK